MYDVVALGCRCGADAWSTVIDTMDDENLLGTLDHTTEKITHRPHEKHLEGWSPPPSAWPSQAEGGPRAALISPHLHKKG